MARLYQGGPFPCDAWHKPGGAGKVPMITAVEHAAHVNFEVPVVSARRVAHPGQRTFICARATCQLEEQEYKRICHPETLPARRTRGKGSAKTEVPCGPPGGGAYLTHVPPLPLTTFTLIRRSCGSPEEPAAPERAVNVSRRGRRWRPAQEQGRHASSPFCQQLARSTGRSSARTPSHALAHPGRCACTQVPYGNFAGGRTSRGQTLAATLSQEIQRRT